MIVLFLKTYIALCIEIYSNLFKDVIMFSVFRIKNESSNLMFYTGKCNN